MLKLQTKNYKLKTSNGYIAISTVLVISLAVLVISTTVTMLSINEGQTSVAMMKGEGSLNLVEGCAEDALSKLRLNNSYAGGPITRPEGACSIIVTGTSTPWTITATTDATDYRKSLTIIVNKINNKLKISSWREN